MSVIDMDHPDTGINEAFNSEENPTENVELKSAAAISPNLFFIKTPNQLKFIVEQIKQREQVGIVAYADCRQKDPEICAVGFSYRSNVIIIQIELMKKKGYVNVWPLLKTEIYENPLLLKIGHHLAPTLHCLFQCQGIYIENVIDTQLTEFYYRFSLEPMAFYKEGRRRKGWRRRSSKWKHRPLTYTIKKYLNININSSVAKDFETRTALCENGSSFLNGLLDDEPSLTVQQDCAVSLMFLPQMNKCVEKHLYAGYEYIMNTKAEMAITNDSITTPDSSLVLITEEVDPSLIKSLIKQ